SGPRQETAGAEARRATGCRRESPGCLLGPHVEPRELDRVDRAVDAVPALFLRTPALVIGLDGLARTPVRHLRPLAPCLRQERLVVPVDPRQFGRQGALGIRSQPIELRSELRFEVRYHELQESIGTEVVRRMPRLVRLPGRGGWAGFELSAQLLDLRVDARPADEIEDVR